MKKKSIISILKDQSGVTAVVVGIFLTFVGIGFAAIAIDIGYRHIAQNELQDAADAGALAGARALYWGNGQGINTGSPPDPTGTWGNSANQIAFDTATVNQAAGKSVQVNNPLDNNGAADEDVQRGHWSFGYGALPRGFYCDSENAGVTAPVDLGSYDTITLDGMKTFINAVKVTARRAAPPISTFFGIIFGIPNYGLSATAVAWIGFTGELNEFEVDLPIAICAESIWEDYCPTGNEPGCNIFDPTDKLACNYGRMLNSGASINDHNTGGWTNFTWGPCSTASTTSMREILSGCGSGSGVNPGSIPLYESIGTTGGVVDSLINHPVDDSLMNCWLNAVADLTPDDGVENPVSIDTDGDGWPDRPWPVVLPVISCPGNNVGPCSKLIGAVYLEILWILEKENDIDGDAPYKMEDSDGPWGPSDYGSTNGEGTDVAGEIRWDSFVNRFNLQTVNSDPNANPPFIELATVANDGFKKKSIYFKPICDAAVPTGGSGGTNYGMLAKEPKIVNVPKKDCICNDGAKYPPDCPCP